MADSTQLWRQPALPLTILLLGLTAFAVHPARADRVTLAAVRPDGILVPFATFEAGVWTKPWPEASDDVPEPASSEDVTSIWSALGEPVPRAWRLWPVDGSAPRWLDVRGARSVRAHCQEQPGLVSSFAPLDVDLHETVGIAVDGDQPLGSVERLAQSPASGSAELQAVRSFIDGRFGDLEGDAIRDWQRLATGLDAPDVSRHGGLEVMSMYRAHTAQAGLATYYFESRRVYDVPLHAGWEANCHAATFAAGWVLRDDADRLTLARADAVLTDCDGKDTWTVRPFATLRAGPVDVWVVRRHGWEDEAFEVVEVTATGVRTLVRFSAGGC